MCFTSTVNATQLFKVKGKLQKVSTGAALSVQAMANDHATFFEGSETIQQVIDEKREIQYWKPAHLYVFTDRATAKVCVSFQTTWFLSNFSSPPKGSTKNRWLIHQLTIGYRHHYVIHDTIWSIFSLITKKIESSGEFA